MGKYIELTSANFDATTKEGVSLVDFWAPWCGPCRMISPVLENLAEEFKDKAKICKINVDEESNLAIEYGVRSIPAIFILKDGEIKDSLIGATSKEVLAEKINKILG